MDIIQNFYDNMSSPYDKLFLDRLFQESGFDKTAAVLDCACGIGTQPIVVAYKGTEEQ